MVENSSYAQIPCIFRKLFSKNNVLDCLLRPRKYAVTFTVTKVIKHHYGLHSVTYRA